MVYGTIDIKLRPIKLAFLVNPTDKAALLEAIQINTFLWGGMFNPIIPTFYRIPKVWQDRTLRNLNSKKILAGYLNAYDPDYVVPVGKCADLTLDIGNRQVITSSEILDGVEEDGTPSYGIGLFEILRYFIYKELKFIRSEPLDICLPNLGKPFRPFMASIFGYLSQNIEKIFKEEFEEILGVKRLFCSISNFSEFLTLNKLFLRRISSLYLTPIRMRAWRRGQCIFFLDATNILDIIDYWNLRAVGWNVIPIPKQASEFKSSKRLALNFINKNFFPDRFNPQIYHNTTLLKSRSVAKRELEEFTKSLKIPPPGKPGESKIVLQHWYPRIWDEWARDKDDVECCELKARIAQHDLSDYQDKINFRTLDPEFIRPFGGHGEARFANEIEFHFYGSGELLAEVIPEGNEKLVKAIGAIGPSEWRFSKKGMVYLSRHSNWSVHISLPKAEDIFLQWLKSKKWKVDLSSPGLIAKQMVKQLGGISRTSILVSEGIISLLDKMSEGKTIKEEAFQGEISKIANQEKFIIDPNRIIQWLIDAQIFRVGVEIQCPICRQHSWYSIKAADYELQCLKCNEMFQIPSHSPKEIKWSYRTIGPFSLPNQAHGAYSVLLTLRFFSQLLDGATTPIMSFKAQKDNKEIESDLGLFFQASKFGSTKTELIFAECKTYNHFEKEDTERMVFLADQFPGAILVFSTLQKALTEKEKRLLRPVVNRGRRYWKYERPFNPVLILTGIELFSRWKPPPQCWEDVVGKHATFAKDYMVRRDLLQLCDATQQLYLDMEPWHEWLKERWEKRRQKRALSL